MMRQAIVRPSEILTAEEKAILLRRAGVGSIAWARRVRLEAEALDVLLTCEPEPSNVVPFGRRSSAAWGQS